MVLFGYLIVSVPEWRQVTRVWVGGKRTCEPRWVGVGLCEFCLWNWVREQEQSIRCI